MRSVLNTQFQTVFRILIKPQINEPLIAKLPTQLCAQRGMIIRPILDQMEG